MSQPNFRDDPTIANDSILWRRIYPKWVVNDDNENGFRLSSAAFDNSRDGTPTSIHLEEIARASGLTPEAILVAFPGYGMASLTAGQARACQQSVGKDPLPDDPTHGFIAGNKTGSIKKQLAKACQWVIRPETPGDGH